LNWEIAGVLGELIGAAAVVVTLIYLAKQVRHSIDYSKADSVQATNAQYIQVFSQLTQNLDMAVTYSKALKNEALTDVETIRFFAFLNIYFAWVESIYNQGLAGLGFEDHLDGTTDLFENIKPYASRLLYSEAGKQWWRTEAESNFTPAFVEGLRRTIVCDADNEHDA
jgi:hypothetical protein